MEDKRIEEHIVCDCGQHILQVTHDIDVFDGRFTQETYLSMFSYGYGMRPPSLKWRIITAWKVLTKGTMHEDSICMHENEAKKLRDFLNKNIIE